MSKLLLTFDIEDFVNSNAPSALHTILELLRKYKLKGIFFVTGHMAEKLGNFPEIVDLLKDNEVGFHSSGHSVHPTIPEYTDVKSYDQAYQLSIERETSHINPLTGKIEKEGGLCVLQDLFAPKKITAFRAPGMNWTPPNLEALRDLGIKFDFSSNISNSKKFHYKGITFYPYTFSQTWDGTLADYQCLLYALLRREIAVFDLHPTLYVNQYEWDSIYYGVNPQTLHGVPKRPPNEMLSLFRGFELLLKQLSLLEKTKLIQTEPNLCKSHATLRISRNHIEEVYNWSMRWSKRFKYKPKFVFSHFNEFFGNACQ